MNETILKRVRRVEISTRRVLDDLMSGSFRSHFKGQGVQFSEHRTYTSGDDVRRIDWKVSARSKEPLLKLYEEERELSVLIIADLSASLGFGSTQNTKRDVLVELAAVISYAAMLSGDKSGVIISGGNEVEKIIPLKKGRNHTLRVIRDLLSSPLYSKPTELSSAFQQARRILKHTGVIFVLSDFRSGSYEKEIKQLSRKHDVVAIHIEDPKELSPPPFPSLITFDPETQLENATASLKNSKLAGDSGPKKILSQCRAEYLRVSTTEDYVEKLLQLFQKRKRR